MKNLTLICEAQLKLVQEATESTNPSGNIEARVTTWGAREGVDGRRFNYQPEGFADWAKEFAQKEKPLPMYVNHNDLGMPVGEWTEFMFDDEGMSAKGRLYLSTQGGSDIYSILKESPNMFGGVSVGAYAEEACMVDAEGNELPMDDNTDNSYFQITKGGLREVSVVMYPNNPEAEIHKLEYFMQDGSLDLRVLEKDLRDAGVSQRNAVVAASVFKKVLEQREVAEKPIENAPPQREFEAEATEANELLKALELRELSKALEKRIK
jgi:HK97 family phage prohead protease